MAFIGESRESYYRYCRFLSQEERLITDLFAAPRVLSSTGILKSALDFVWNSSPFGFVDIRRAIWENIHHVFYQDIVIDGTSVTFALAAHPWILGYSDFVAEFGLLGSAGPVYIADFATNRQIPSYTKPA